MRLTHLCEYKDKRKNREPMLKIRNKLFELENIEDELGIDLITLFKASKNGYYVKEETGIYEVLPGNINDVDLIRKCISSQHGFAYFVSLFKDYGKTWALTEQELKKGEQ